MAVDRIALVNGQAYAWVDINVVVLGVPLSGITEIKYSQEAEIEDNYGAGRFPVSRGHGKIKTECSMTIDRAELNSLIAAAPNKNILNIPEFDIIVSYLPDGSVPVTDTIKNVRFKKTTGGGTEGDKNIMAEIDLIASHIQWNSLS